MHSVSSSIARPVHGTCVCFQCSQLYLYKIILLLHLKIHVCIWKLPEFKILIKYLVVWMFKTPWIMEMFHFNVMVISRIKRGTVYTVKGSIQSLWTWVLITKVWTDLWHDADSSACGCFACTYVHVCMCPCMLRQELMLIPLLITLPCFLRQGFSLDQELTDWLDCLVSEPQWHSCLHLPSAVLILHMVLGYKL